MTLYHFKKAGKWLCFAYLFAFLLLYLPIYAFETSENTLYVLGYVNYALFDVIARFSVPVILGAILLISSPTLGRVRTALYAVALSLPALFYTLPYYYLEATESGSDWKESIGYSVLYSLIELIVLSLNTAVIYLIARQIALFDSKKRLLGKLPLKKRESLSRSDKEEIITASEKELTESLDKRGIFNFSIPFVKGIFFGAFTQFSIFAVYEIASVISHLIDFGDFRTSELLYVIGKFVMIFLLLFASHAVCYLITVKFSEDNDENEDV